MSGTQSVQMRGLSRWLQNARPQSSSSHRPAMQARLEAPPSALLAPIPPKLTQAPTTCVEHPDGPCPPRIVPAAKTARSSGGTICRKGYASAGEASTGSFERGLCPQGGEGRVGHGGCIWLAHMPELLSLSASAGGCAHRPHLPGCHAPRCVQSRATGCWGRSAGRPPMPLTTAGPRGRARRCSQKPLPQLRAASWRHRASQTTASAGRRRIQRPTARRAAAAPAVQRRWLQGGRPHLQSRGREAPCWDACMHEKGKALAGP